MKTILAATAAAIALCFLIAITAVTVCTLDNVFAPKPEELALLWSNYENFGMLFLVVIVAPGIISAADEIEELDRRKGKRTGD